MSKPFSVGELVILQYGTYHAQHDGALAVVTRGLNFRWATDKMKGQSVFVLCYGVKALVTPPLSFLTRPHQLRPLKGEPEKSLLRIEEEPVLVE
jgi:hypothetical protein